MYEADTQTKQAAPVDEEMELISRRFMRMGQGGRIRLLDQLVRMHQSSQAETLRGPRVLGGEATCDAGQGEAGPSMPRGITLDNLERVFTYQSWASDQIRQAEPVKEAILALGRAVLRNVPDCPDRSVALRKLRELRMDVNAAITHRGEF